MLRVTSIIGGLALLALGVLATAPRAAAQQPPPPTTKTLVNQRVEELPQGPVCWRVNRATLPPGVRFPAEGYTSGPLRLSYVLAGEGQRIEYAGGPTLTHRSGEALFIGTDNWYARTNIGTTGLVSILFQLTCAAAPGTPVGVTGVLPGIKPGPVPYQLQLLEITGRPGSQTPAQSTTGPLTSYFLEGTVAVTTPAGVTQYKAGDLLVIPPGTPFTTATVGDATARALVTLLTPAGEPPSRTVPPSIDVRALISQRVEELPQGPLCWNVIRDEIPPGGRVPPQGYQDPTLSVAYNEPRSAAVRIDYAGGPSRTVNPGEGTFIGAHNWFARINIGTTPASAVVFVLTCAQIPPGIPGLTLLGKTEVLPGIRPGPVPYVANLLLVSGVPGARQLTPGIQPGPIAWYVLEGTIAQSTPAGITTYRAGDLFLQPVGTPFQNFNVGDGPIRVLVVQLLPVGVAGQPLPDLKLPSPVTPGVPAALPRTGEPLPWAGPAAILAGLLLLAAGFGLRRAKS